MKQNIKDDLHTYPLQTTAATKGKVLGQGALEKDPIFAEYVQKYKILKPEDCWVFLNCILREDFSKWAQSGGVARP